MTCCDATIDCIPVLAVLSIFCWSYYGYVVEFCVNTVESPDKQIPYLIFFHVFFTMSVISYISVMCTDIDGVPEEYKLPSQYNEELKNCKKEEEGNAILERVCRERQLNLYTISSNGFVRYCSKCKHIKPDRTHHCSTCKTCVLKMDHHCPWVNNCVGFSNYKIFLTFLLHTTIFCLFCCGTTFEYFVAFWLKEGTDKKSRHYQILILFMISGALGMLVFFFFTYHMSLVFRNETTLEALREERFKNPNNTFDLGCADNFLEVFGENCWCWFCPVQTSLGNGVDFVVTLKE